MNIWHDISDDRIKAEEFIAVIEIPKGSKIKYEIDKETGMLELDRIPPSGMYQPFNYGFIPRTLCEDGDALDVCVICSEPIQPMALVKCKPIALVNMIDDGERDEKVIAVPVKDPNNDVPRNAISEYTHYLKHYKSNDPTKGPVQVNEVEGKEKAMAIIRESKALYSKKFGGKK